MSDLKKAAIVGCGAIAPIHALALEQSDFVQLYSVCDNVPSKCASLSKYKAKEYYSFEQVIADEEIDVVHICTPHYLHTQMLRQCARSCKDVVVEKPVTIDVDDLAETLEIIDKCGIRVMAVLQNRFNPCVKQMKEMITNKDMGELLSLKGSVCWARDRVYYQHDEWRGKWATEGGGLVINQAVHMLDLLSFLGGGARSIKGSFDSRVLGDVIEVEDTAEATLYFDNQVRGHFFATNTYNYNQPFEITLSFEKGIVRYIDGKLFDKDFNCLAEDISTSAGKKYWGVGHGEIVNNFYSSICGQPQPYPTIHDGADAAKLALGLYASHRLNQKYML